MSSCSEPMMETISCCEPVQDSADEPVSSCCEGINERQVTEETAGLDSSAKNPNEETSISAIKSFAVEAEDAQPMTCSYEETAQNEGSVHREDAEEMNLEDTRDLSSRCLVDFKHQIAVKRRTAIVTRLDGVNLSTGSEVSFYKCHLCGKLFGRLADVPMHLSMHSPQQMTLYQCLLCEGSFSFKTKLVQHLRIHHNVNLPRRGEISEKGPLDTNNVSSDCGPKIISQKKDEFLQSGAGNALRASPETPHGLEISSSRSNEESDAFSAPQYKMLHLSVEAGDRIPGDQFILEKLGLDKLSDGRERLFHCDPVKGLTKTNSFLCQICGFESWRQNRLLHHVIKHHLNSVAVQKMRKQLLHRRKLPLPHRTSESNLLRKFGNSGELKTFLSETSNCLTSSAAESHTVTSTAPNVECKEEPLSLSMSPKSTDCSSEHKGIDDPVLNKRDDLQGSPRTNYSEMGESCHIMNQIENEKLPMSPVSATSTEQLKVMDNKVVSSSSSLVSMQTSSSICNITPDTTIPTSSSAMMMSSLITAHETGSECKPLVFNPSNVSPLLRGFLPLPLLSLFVSQSTLNPASFLGTSNSNSQFPSDPVKISQQSFSEKFSTSHASNSWDQNQKFEATEQEDIKPTRAALDWRVMVRNRTRGLASRGSSTLNTK